ncbi:hypothetical protein ACU639_24405 [Streptomyces cynarae]|uniref:hypothetical protein n=1 Tax=Streptomyces cynarae TaxID=2981134 RepID=UPI00406C7809
MLDSQRLGRPRSSTGTLPDGTAHVFNVIRDRNGVVFLDGQAGMLGNLEKNVTEIRYLPYK